MSEEQLKAFWEAIQADTSLQEKLRAATDADSIASIAKEAGFEITADEVKEAQGELTEEQLKAVAGGHPCYKLTLNQQISEPIKKPLQMQKGTPDRHQLNISYPQEDHSDAT